jgi:endonuclease YncB( thermonuclease family)
MYALLIIAALAQDYPIVVEKVHDGDTITATIQLGFDIELKHQEIRIKDFDAYEINKVRRTVKVTDEEIVKGKLAQADLEALLKQARKVYVTEGKRGAYGRLELSLFINDKYGDDQDVALLMILAGYDRVRQDKLIGIPKLRELQEAMEK